MDVYGKSPRALVKNVWQQRRKKWARENMLFGTFFCIFDAWVNVFRPSASVRSKGLDHWDCFSWFSYVTLLQTPFLGSQCNIQGPCQVADGIIFWHSTWHSFWHILIYSDILSGILFCHSLYSGPGAGHSVRSSRYQVRRQAGTEVDEKNRRGKEEEELHLCYPLVN